MTETTDRQDVYTRVTTRIIADLDIGRPRDGWRQQAATAGWCGLVTVLLLAMMTPPAHAHLLSNATKSAWARWACSPTKRRWSRWTAR